MFGNFIKETRIKRRLGLREFCLETGQDPSNWSKTERGLLPPPQDKETLTKIAKVLKIKKNSEEWSQLFDSAALDRGKLPTDIIEDKELLRALPVFFRTLRGQKPCKEELENLVELIRKG